jgi:hypothetical protein
VKESSDSGCATSDCADQANYVTVDHGDGTRAIYYHLQLNGALVNEGDRVGAGEPIGLSGNTGWSTRPHLHIEVKDFLYNSLPMLFEDVSENQGVLYPGGSYVSGNVQTAPDPALQYSSCREDTFSYRGLLLDSEIPCSVAKEGQAYRLLGEAYVGGQVQVAQYSNLNKEWMYSCAALDQDGYFDTEIIFDSEVLGSSAYLMVSPASESRCAAFQGWDRSILVKIRD